jgi:ATP-dependent DNA helicase PIF1
MPVKSEMQCFEAQSWNESIDYTCELRQIVRQKDQKFQKMLDELRHGYCSDETYKILESRVGVSLKNDMGIKPTKLYPKNSLVDQTNQKQLDSLIKRGAEYHTYKADYSVKLNNTSKSSLKLIEEFKNYGSSGCPDDLTLAVGTQVVFKKNIDELVANGTRAVISSFMNLENGSTVPVVSLLDGSKRMVEPLEFSYAVEKEFEVIKSQLPLKLAWACSIHSSQGSTLDLVEADIGDNIFESGQVYVVLSRVRTLEGLSLISINRHKIWANPKVLKRYGADFLEKQKERELLTVKRPKEPDYGFRVFFEKKCPLCHEDFNDTPDLLVIALNCGHMFHEKCSDKYNGDKCSLCRGVAV